MAGDGLDLGAASGEERRFVSLLSAFPCLHAAFFPAVFSTTGFDMYPSMTCVAGIITGSVRPSVFRSLSFKLRAWRDPQTPHHWLACMHSPLGELSKALQLPDDTL